MSDKLEIRIGCLEPSATAICIALGLASKVVGITHECNMQAVVSARAKEEQEPTSGDIFVLTKDGLGDISSQAEIHHAVSADACRRKGKEEENQSEKSISSLYPIMESNWKSAGPSVVFTQDLCAVCAPTTADVKRIVDKDLDKQVTVVSLQPTTLEEVAETFVIVGRHCDVPERGIALKETFINQLSLLKHAIDNSRNHDLPKPTILILEWLDPPFDGGHWTADMMDYACLQNSRTKKSHKSEMITWDQVYATDPDVIVVGCCGFDLERNVKDLDAARDKFQDMKAGKSRKIFACDGNLYIAQPSPLLVTGTALLAQCAYQDQPKVLEAIDALNLTPKPETAWRQISQKETQETTAKAVVDIEDAQMCFNGYEKLHREAVENGKLTYTDEKTGYQVFTELAHKQRGKCCGSGCRHCPYGHENLKDKVGRSQQPSLLYSSTSSFLSPDKNEKVKVLFFSGGKDSFLTIRALVRSWKKEPFGLVLLTTFDATTRVVAHQEIHIENIVKQAKHLDISLCGVPLHRASGESYFDRMKRALKVIQMNVGEEKVISALVFGDLHLEHVKEWRDTTLLPVGISLEYPLWQVPFQELIDDLEKSTVPCLVSASTCDEVEVGTLFDRRLYNRLSATEIDGFGERGEFHSLAQVWKSQKETALGV